MHSEQPTEGTKPVVLLVYADTGQPLPALKDEVTTIAAALQAGGRCEVVRVGAATLDDLLAPLNNAGTRDRIRVVHYAGHANGRGIELVDPAGRRRGQTAFMDGLARVFAPLEQLRLLFLNGCSTEEQALVLLRAGIPLIIATRGGVADELARDVAVRFYGALANDRPVGESYAVAEGAVDAGGGRHREVGGTGPPVGAGSAWAIYGPRSERTWRFSDPPYRRAGPPWNPANYPFNPDLPYPGLRPFTGNEAHQFFGRDVFVSELLKALPNAPLRVVVGASGSGKSSVVRAGLVPAWQKKIREAGREPHAFVVTPEDDPFDQVSIALGGEERFDRERVRAVRSGSNTALRDALTALCPDDPWLLCIDQFEHLFTRTRKPDRRDNFIAAVVDLAQTRRPDVSVVLVLRDEFFAPLRDYVDLFPMTDAALSRIAGLGRDALREAVERPAAEHGVGFAPGLVDEIVGEVEGQPADLPLLQYTLRRLWDKEVSANPLGDRLLKRSTYRGLGGVRASLGERFETLYDAEDGDGKAAFRALMLRLVAYRDAGPSSPAVSRLAPRKEFRGKEAALIQKLVDEERLLTARGDFVQLGHDRILEAWSRFSGWAEEHRQANQVRQRLGDAARAWQAHRATDPARAEREFWQGAILDDALRMQAERAFDPLGGLDTPEDDFLRASREQRDRAERARRRWRTTGAVAFVLLTVASAVALWLWRAGVETDKHLKATRLISQKHLTAYLAAQSRQPALAPSLRVLLGVEAVNASRDTDQATALIAEQALREALDVCAGAGLSHPSSSVSAVEVTRDGRVLATGGADGTVWVWDVDGPRPHRVAALSALPSAILALGFSADGSRLYATAMDGTTAGWRRTGMDLSFKQDYLEKQNEKNLRKVVIEADCGLRTSLTEGGIATLWDLRNGNSKVFRDASGARDLTVIPDRAYFQATAMTTVGLIAARPGVATLLPWPLLIPDRTPAKRLAILQPYGSVTLYPVRQWKVSPWWKGEPLDVMKPVFLRARSSMRHLTFGFDNELIATCSDGRCIEWSLESANLALKEPRCSYLNIEGLRATALAGPERYKLFTGGQGALQVWNAFGLGEPRHLLPGLSGSIQQIRCGGLPRFQWKNGRAVAVAVTDTHDARVWELRRSGVLDSMNREGTLLNGQETTPYWRSLSISSDGQWRLGIEKDGAILATTDLEKDSLFGFTRGADCRVTAAAFAGVNAVFTGDNKGSVSAWKLSDGIEPLPLAAQAKGRVRGLTVNLPGNVIAVAADTVSVWKRRGGALEQVAEIPVVASHIGLSWNARWLVTVSGATQDTKGIRFMNLYDLAAAKHPAGMTPIRLAQVGPGFFALAAGGDQLATVGERDSQEIRLRQLGGLNFRAAVSLLTGDAPFTALVFVRNGLLAAGDRNGRVRLWDVTRREPSVIFKSSPGQAISALSFSEDRRWLVAGGINGAVRFWDLGGETFPERQHMLRGRVAAVAIDLACGHVVALNENGAVKRWDLPLSPLLSTAEVAVGRNFTKEEWNTYFSGFETPYRRTFPGYEEGP
jgi:WD40 repeat protein